MPQYPKSPKSPSAYSRAAKASRGARAYTKTAKAARATLAARSNKGGAVRGQERAAQVHEMNAARKTIRPVRQVDPNPMTREGGQVMPDNWRSSKVAARLAYIKERRLRRNLDV